MSVPHCLMGFGSDVCNVIQVNAVVPNVSTCTIEIGKTGELALHVVDDANVLDVYRVDSFQASNASMAEGTAQINFRKVLSCPRF